MAELTEAGTVARPCCAPEQRATCCEPSQKADCCGSPADCRCDAAPLASAGTTIPTPAHRRLRVS